MTRVSGTSCVRWVDIVDVVDVIRLALSSVFTRLEPRKDGGNLVAQAFAHACRHQHQRVLAGDRALDNLFLGATKCIVAEEAFEHGVRIEGRGRVEIHGVYNIAAEFGRVCAEPLAVGQWRDGSVAEGRAVYRPATGCRSKFQRPNRRIKIPRLACSNAAKRGFKAPPVGLEPTTNGLTVRRSTN